MGTTINLNYGYSRGGFGGIALCASPGIAIVSVGMADLTFYNNSRKKINKTPDGDLMYGINQGLAVVALLVIGIFAKGAALPNFYPLQQLKH